MAAKKESKSRLGVYVDSSALVKLYVPEAESEVLDEFLQGRTDILISELVLTEVISAVARRRRESALTAEQASLIRNALMSDAGVFRKLDLNPAIHRNAERILLSTGPTPLRTLDALHIALALGGGAEHIITFDSRMAEAAALHGLIVVSL
jgi:predicted nucleic acid-binding protein